MCTNVSHVLASYFSLGDSPFDPSRGCSTDGNQIPYSVCRNAEWQLCAARGELPGQSERTVIFSFAPKDLTTKGSGRNALGSCTSYAPMGCPDDGYASQDIFYMEVCLYDQICANRDDLWRLRAGQPWHCDLDRGAFLQLKGWLARSP